ncbi:hypothetical protein QUA40_14425 [Microcoleus sp. Pol11C3]|uniref:hypothetical protein n=1 Tax=Microcoleus sp. Pol11C3 TaxID=3055390 RepID=UPI002FCF0F32
MSNNTNQNLNTDTSENQELTPDEIRTVLKPLFEEFNQVLQKYGLKDVEVVNFTTIVSSKVFREATDSSQTILDEYNDILRKTVFSDIYKDLEIIDFTIAATSLVRQKKRKEAFAEIAEIRDRDERTEPITIREPITDEERKQLLLRLKDKQEKLECACTNIHGCTQCPENLDSKLIK